MSNHKEKPEVVQDEKLYRVGFSVVEKPIPEVRSIDYSGAHEKTDPREIALVKKLDKWIMPMLWSMYWYVTSLVFSDFSLDASSLK